jgi:Uma2 family endonuclease
MIRVGILTTDDRVELLDELLVYKFPKTPPHCVATHLTGDQLRRIVPAGWHVTSHGPITMDTSEPEPDLAIIQGGIRDYLDHHPGPEDVAMAIEIADSSLARDRGIKRRIYARAGVPVYWIVDVTERRVEICTAPSGPSDHPAYGTIRAYGEAELLPVVIDGREVGKIAVRDILP